MKLFQRPATAAVFGVAMMALVGKETVSAEEAEAANSELQEAGVTGAALITSAAFNELEQKAGRVDAAETALANEQKARETAEATSAQLQKDLTAANAKVTELGGKPGAEHTNPGKENGKSDVDEAAADEHQKAIDSLPHNQALAGHPIFG
ncbi:hypothetical protein HER32_06715 [Hymenobacter sp. BT18]|uniref:hypothetical protein n=1 Tax=Hymenobacter sp. BT18 TaxID=2835648 RepID=UPI00143E2137|nr:hypothetical protein [Hymenobacter sp. BT18]QIX60885.1 hypothetical protein HER32_06715 [Hymenobacter sp. BT18]